MAITQQIITKNQNLQKEKKGKKIDKKIKRTRKALGEIAPWTSIIKEFISAVLLGK